MTEHWRPEGWIYGDGYAKPQRKNKHCKGRLKAFETGADAMLESLRDSPNSYYVNKSFGAIEGWKHGKYVFIPDDPQTEEEYVYLPWESYRKMWQPHKASKVIEKGCFCEYCFMQVKNLSWHLCCAEINSGKLAEIKGG
jgi:hypothetical protein